MPGDYCAYMLPTDIFLTAGLMEFSSLLIEVWSATQKSVVKGREQIAQLALQSE